MFIYPVLESIIAFLPKKDLKFIKTFFPPKINKFIRTLNLKVVKKDLSIKEKIENITSNRIK